MKSKLPRQAHGSSGGHVSEHVDEVPEVLILLQLVLRWLRISVTYNLDLVLALCEMIIGIVSHLSHLLSQLILLDTSLIKNPEMLVNLILKGLVESLLP